MSLTRRLTLELFIEVEVEDDRVIAPTVQEALREFLRVHIGKDAKHPIPAEHTQSFMDGRGTLRWKMTNLHFEDPQIDPNRPILVEP